MPCLFLSFHDFHLGILGLQRDPMRSANWETGCPSHAWKRCPGENLSQVPFYRTVFVSPYFLSINNSLSLYIVYVRFYIQYVQPFMIIE